MSQMTPNEIQCPKCGNKQETFVWNSINVTLDPDLKKKLLAAEINVFECKKCNHKANINVPLLYHDMDRNFCVSYYPPEALEGSEFFTGFKPDGTLADMGFPNIPNLSADYMFRPHIVFDMNEMIRYVIFRDGLSDDK